MGEAVEKLSGKLGVDTTDFKTGISAANRELRVLESSFKATAASLGDWTKDATGLESRLKTLTDKMEIQKLKVEALRENYEKLAAENGANSIAAKEAQIRLNKETEQLGEMQVETTNTFYALQDLNDVDYEVAESAEEASEEVNNFKSVIGGMGTIVKGAITVVAGLAVAVAGVGAAIGGLVFDTANASAELVDLSAKTGITTTRLQELAYAGDQLGTSSDTITSSLTRLTRSMGEAQQQSTEFNAERAQALADGEEFDKQLGDNAAAFEKLGVKVTDASGNLRDNEAVFADTLTALGRIPNEAERDALAMSIFGKSAQELNPLIKGGAEELAKLSEQAHEVGAVMSEEDVAAFEAFDDTLASLQAGLKGTLGTLAASFLPGFQLFFNQAGGYLTQFSDIVRGSNGDFGAMAQGIGGLITQIVSDIAAQAPKLLETGVTILQSIVQAILGALPTLIPAAVNIILTLVQFLIENLPMIIDAGLKAIVALATGIASALPTLIPAIVEALITIVTTLVDNIPLIIDAALQLILGLAQGLIIALPVLIAALPQIISSIIDALIGALPMIFDAAGQLIGMLATGILAAIPVLALAIGELIVRIGESIAKWIQTAPELGKKFIQGLVNGIKNATGLLYDAVINLANGMIAKIQQALGIASPSKIGVDIGENLIGSLGSGGQKGAPRAGEQLANVAQQLANKLNVAMTGGAGLTPSFAGAGGGGISIGDIYVDARGATDPQAVGQAVSDSVLKKLRSLGGA